MTKNAIEIENLTVAYRGKPALWDVSLTVPEGVLMAIVGPNGAGKSTLIKTMMNLVPRAGGTIKFYGKSYRRMRNSVAYVPQRASVDWDYPTSVLGVVLMGLYGQMGLFQRPGKKEKALAMEALEKVDMVDFAGHAIAQLSGGQQQRTFLARALVQDAQIYLMDEPFAAVDAVTERAIVTILQELRSRERTVLVVHHDLQTLQEYFDWAALINQEVFVSGAMETTCTPDNLRRTYGGQFMGWLSGD